MMSDFVGLGLLVVLDTLSPAVRLAFVLRDIFATACDQFAPMSWRTPVAAKKLANHARHRVQGRDAAINADVVRQRKVVRLSSHLLEHGI